MDISRFMALYKCSSSSYYYINDLPNLTQSNTFLCAADIKLFRPIMNRDDQSRAYTKTWYYRHRKLSANWMLKLHPDKCMHMEIGTNNVAENNIIRQQTMLHTQS